MKTCDRCGRPSDYSTCTLCLSIERERREDIEREQEARAERLEQSREYLEQSRENAELVAEARINPGDYDCPECFFRTLKYRARRCPTCQASIGTEYWNQVDERKRIEAERAAERARADAKAAKENGKGRPPHESRLPEKQRRIWRDALPKADLIHSWGSSMSLCPFCVSSPFS